MSPVCSELSAYPWYLPGSYPHTLIKWFLTAIRSDSLTLEMFFVTSEIPFWEADQRFAPEAFAPVAISLSPLTNKNNLFFEKSMRHGDSLFRYDKIVICKDENDKYCLSNESGEMLEILVCPICGKNLKEGEIDNGK